ncbi:putative serine/threonine-protein kinase iks1, partial [Coemansia thaxteri]
MSIRRRNIHRSRSQDASQQAQQLHHRITADWAVSGPFSTQLVPYSPWRVILYKRPMGQAVLYNQDNDAVEVQSIVSRTRPQPLAPVSVAGNQNNSLAVAAKNRDSAVSMPQHRISVCPTCLQIVPAHAAGGWEQQINAISSNGVESDTVADREYFKLLARSLRPHRVSLELPGTHGELRPETSYNGSDDEDQSHRAVPATAGAVTGSPSLDVIGYDHDVLSPISLLESKGRGATAGEEESKSPGGVAASSFNQGYYERFFVEQKKLGKGLRGSVFSCQHILDSVYLGQYAVKKVAVGNNHQWLKRMLREVKLLESLRHPNVIEYKHSWLEMHQLTNFGPNVPCLFILMEYANGGNLQEFMEPRTPSLLDAGNSTSEIKQRILRMRRQSRQGKSAAMTANHTLDSGELDGGRRTLTIDQIWSLFSDICSGLAHLHQLQIIHRDLKHMNLLLHWKDPAHKDTSGEVPRILLTDFGECEVLSHVEKRDRTGATGTLEFMPPELIAVDDMGRFLDSYSTKSDMWSLGMVFYYLCYSSLPYSNIDNIDVLRKAVLGFTHVDFAKAQRPN